ncbi:MAG: flagellar basal body rod protein FlgC [Nitrospirae bacterium]|nr:flagellar basal body rod protein FlgC [Nitrospirota bacterium]
MDMFGVFSISASALEAQRTRMNVIASNMANVHTTKTQEGGPYKRQNVVFRTLPMEKDPATPFQGVMASEIVKDQGQPMLVYEPGNPDANANGYVEMPNINVVEEMVDMMTASRAYEANVSVFNASKGMFTRTLDIGR